MSEMYDTLKFERDGAVPIITLDRPSGGKVVDVVMARADASGDPVRPRHALISPPSRTRRLQRSRPSRGA